MEETLQVSHEKKIGHRDCSRWAYSELMVTKMVTASRDWAVIELWPSRDWAVIILKMLTASLKLIWNLPGANELIHWSICCCFSANTSHCAYYKPPDNESMLMIVAYVMAAICGVCLLPLLILVLHWQFQHCRRTSRDMEEPLFSVEGHWPCSVCCRK